ncbi:MAG TPA: hypothetical protein VF075_09665, partial [Pyrinomonadaceae bacterium]
MQILKANRLIQTLLLTVLFFSTVSGVRAQGGEAQPSPTQTPSPGASPSPSASPKVQPKVVATIGNLELDDILEVNVDKLEEWAETHDPTKLVPYINGRAIKGNYPEELHLERGRLIYHLEITPENKRVWVDLLGAPSSMREPVSLSVGLEDGSAFDSVHVRSNPVTLTVISPVYGLIALLVIVTTAVLLIWLVRKTNIIREPGPPPAPGKRRPYNLGRAQMAFWFFLIYSSYVAIWLITDALDTITASLLALMGISAGTALGEALIDNGKDTSKANQIRDLTAEKQALEQAVSQAQTELDSVNTTAAATLTDQSNRDAMTRQLIDERTRLSQIDQQLRTLSQGGNPTSSGFIRDILSDGSGYSFHRFQIFAWTIVLGIIFISSVY